MKAESQTMHEYFGEEEPASHVATRLNDFDRQLNFLLDICFLEYAPAGTKVRVYTRWNNGPYDATIESWFPYKPTGVLWAHVWPLKGKSGGPAKCSLSACRHQLIKL